MASAESKIAGAITAAAVSIIVAFVVVPEIKEHRARAEINQMVKEFTEEMDLQSVRSTGQCRAKRRQQQWQCQGSRIEAWPGSTLHFGPGGSNASPGYVPTYEQITRNGRPVRCVGNKRV